MKLILLVICALMACASASTDKVGRSDEGYSAGLLGTWEAPVARGSDKILSTSTYTQDGFVGGYSTGTASHPDGRTEEFTFKVRARWRVEGGVLIVTDYETQPPGIIPKGYGQKYRIASLDDGEVVFRALDDGSELYRRRPKAGPATKLPPGAVRGNDRP